RRGDLREREVDRLARVRDHADDARALSDVDGAVDAHRDADAAVGAGRRRRVLGEGDAAGALGLADLVRAGGDADRTGRVAVTRIRLPRQAVDQEVEAPRIAGRRQALRHV